MTRARIADKANQLHQRFLQTGAELVDVDMFLPAKRLLNLYGEDIRARAYIMEDSINILRPDFTVLIVEYHLGKAGVGESRYCYNGPVWRKSLRGPSLPREFPQVGIEVFGAPDPSLAEADIFALFFDILKGELGQNPSVVTGDIGLLRAAINGLNTTTARRRALLRHLWHPKRFNRLLKQFSGNNKLVASRKKLIKQIKEDGFEEAIADAGTFIGERSRDEIRARVDILIKESETSMLDGKKTKLIDAILALDTNAADALKQVQEWERNYSCLSDAVKQMEARFKAFKDKGINLELLDFKGNYGLTDLEYYDGFVFRFTDKSQKTLATGGRYDALVKRLGRKKLNAIGGVIRPDILLQAMEG